MRSRSISALLTLILPVVALSLAGPAAATGTPVTGTPAATSIPAGMEALTEQIRRRVSERLKVPLADVEVLSLGLSGAPVDAAWTVELPSGNLWGTVSLRLVAALPDGSERRYTTYTKISVWDEVPVAVAEAAAGEPVAFVMERQRLDAIRSGEPVDPARRWQARGSIHAGDVLTQYRVEPLPDALSGATVRLVVSHGALRVEAPGKLAADAFVGLPVEVVNLATQATLTGIYEGGGRVRVGTP